MTKKNAKLWTVRSGSNRKGDSKIIPRGYIAVQMEPTNDAEYHTDEDLQPYHDNIRRMDFRKSISSPNLGCLLDGSPYQNSQNLPTPHQKVDICLHVVRKPKPRVNPQAIDAMTRSD